MKKTFSTIAILIFLFAVGGAYAVTAPYTMQFSHWPASGTPADSVEGWFKYVAGSSGAYSSPNVVSPPKAAAFKTVGDSIITPLIDNPDTMKVWFRTMTGGGLPDSVSTIFKIYAKVGTGSFTEIHQLTLGSAGELYAEYRQLILPLSATYRGQTGVQFKFWFVFKASGTNIAMDDFSVTAPGGADVTPPAISSVTVLGNTSIDVLFNEPVQQATAETESNYVVTPGSLVPTLATRDGSNLSLVHLTFNPLADNAAYTLTVNGVQDIAGNACVNATGTFSIDATPPSITSVTASNNTAVDVLFNETVQLASAQVITNYSVNNGIGNALTASRDLTNLALVHLTFNPMVNNNYILTANGVQDLLGNACVNATGNFTVNVTVAAGSVVINEIMYDDTASGDSEWVELHNTTASAINMSDWVLIDAGTYPASGSEGGIRIPTGTIIAANGYIIVSKVSTLALPGAVACQQYYGSFALGNSGDNLALYTDDSTGTLVDGSLTAFYPDLATADAGSSIEKCVESDPWSSTASAWHASTNVYSATGRYRHCTPSATNSVCVADLTPPTLVSAVVTGSASIDVTFSEDVDLTTSQVATNYSVDNGFGNPTSAVRQTNASVVRLTFASNFTPNNYILTVNNVQDLNTNVILANSTIGFVVQASTAHFIFTEFMPNPNFAGNADSLGEWFEIYNTGTSAIDLFGFRLTDNSGSDTIDTHVSINPNQYFVFCSNGDPVTNGGVPNDYAYHYGTSGWGLALNNTGETISIYDNNGILVNATSYLGLPWSAGVSAQRNDTGWCAATATWAGATQADFGTPQAASICGAPFIPDTLSVCAMRATDTCGVAALLNSRHVTRGVVYFADTCRSNAYMESGGCGITIYGTPLYSNMVGLARLVHAGDSVMIDGYVTQFRGLIEISTHASFVPVITFIDSGHTVAAANLAANVISTTGESCNAEAYESRKVKVGPVAFLTDTFRFGAYNYPVVSGTDTAFFRVDSCDVLFGAATPTGQVFITAALTQFDSVSCLCQGYQLAYIGGTTFTPALCSDPLSMTVRRIGLSDQIELRWQPGVNQICTCYKIWWTTDATAVFPASYTELATVNGVTTHIDTVPLSTKRFYVVTAVACP